MRIITGKAKGAKLKAPKGLNTRPTADRIKESLFNILAYDIQGTEVLDLFSGTGNIGLEAVSRGAKRALLVDRDRESIAAMKYNVNHTGLQEDVMIKQGDVFTIISKLAQNKELFDIIFADPPYKQGLELKLLNELTSNIISVKRGLLIIEHSRDDELPVECGSYELIRKENYGSTTSISFYRYKTEEENLCV